MHNIRLTKSASS